MRPSKMEEMSLENFPPYEVFYIESMLTRTSSALASVQISNGIVKSLALKGEAELPFGWRKVLLDQMQNLIIQGGAISRFFWPPRDGKQSEHKKRGAFLREVFDVQIGNALESRRIRNQLEHFDEKLDVYLQKMVVGRILPEFVGYTSETDGVPLHMFRGYFLDTGVFQILEEKFEVNPLINEIIRVDKLLKKFNETGRLRKADAPLDFK